MKKNILPIISTALFIFVIGFFVLLGNIIEKYIPTEESMDLSSHFKLTESDEVAILLNNELIPSKAKLLHETVYFSLDTVLTYLNPRFYWDANENLLRYATATDLVSVPAESSSYTITKDTHSFDHVIVTSQGDTPYIAIDFVKEFTDFSYEVFTEPNRVILTTVWGDYTTVTVKKPTQLRVVGDIKSPILAYLKKGDTLTLLEEAKDWSKVRTEDGIIGFIKSKALGVFDTKTLQSDYVAEEFTHIKENHKINLAWHQVINKNTNKDVSTILQNAKGINVLSPSWFYLKDSSGALGSVASTDYVNYCHQQGVDVWGQVSNLGAKNHGLEVPDFMAVLRHSSNRDLLVNNLISAAIQYNLDGLNIHFEELQEEDFNDYIQFIRELSLKCANNGIVLSVNIPAPHLHTFFDCKELSTYADYIVVMALDEYDSKSEESGPTASIGFVTDALAHTAQFTDSSQILLGLPFYAKLWCKTPVETEAGVTYELSCRDTSMKEQQNLIRTNGATAVWLDEVGCNFVEYENKNSIYQIWVEDASSMEQKLKLIDSYQIAGGAFWRLGLEASSIWDTIIKYIN